MESATTEHEIETAFSLLDLMTSPPSDQGLNGLSSKSFHEEAVDNLPV
jgi:hypothetical protein